MGPRTWGGIGHPDRTVDRASVKGSATDRLAPRTRRFALRRLSCPKKEGAHPKARPQPESGRDYRKPSVGALSSGTTTSVIWVKAMVVLVLYVGVNLG